MQWMPTVRRHRSDCSTCPSDTVFLTSLERFSLPVWQMKKVTRHNRLEMYDSSGPSTATGSFIYKDRHDGPQGHWEGRNKNSPVAGALPTMKSSDDTPYSLETVTCCIDIAKIRYGAPVTVLNDHTSKQCSVDNICF